MTTSTPNITAIVATRKAWPICLRIRHIVFVDEQGISEADEYDGHDDECIHFLAKQGLIPVGAARMKIDQEDYAKAERVAVLKECRGLGVGKLLMDELEKEAKRIGKNRVELGAQLSAVEFYQKIGYEPYGEIFLDAEIEHRMMKKHL